jgi:peptidyl-prolyl cis-trans isomerase B (cyclophilin B)
MMINRILCVVLVTTFAVSVKAQSNNQIEPPKKANARATSTPAPAGDPFDGATVEKMAGQCVTLETELGPIDIAIMPENAPEAARNFLNLSATGALDTTTFSRVVKGFVIQGGNLQTSEKWSEALAKRMSHRLPDEPGLVKHVRGIVSMARTEEANSATTHFFILVAPAPHLDSKFAAFGTVTKGMEIVDEINQAPVDGDKPDKPVKINRAVVSPCKK